MKKGYIFHSGGLRFDRSHLHAIKNSILKMPVETQAEYVDAVVYDCCENGTTPPAYGDPIDYDRMNATSIGNLAFLSLYHPDEYVRGHAAVILSTLKNRL